MKISRNEVQHVARLARLALSDAELDALTGDMDAILAYVDQLDRLETGAIIPMATRACLERIAATDPQLNAFITVCAEQALTAAAAADRRLADGNGAPLTGIPLALKDIFVTEGVRTTCASKILENFIPPYDGTAVARLKERGAVILGKLNMDEFAMGSSNENSAFGPVATPGTWRRSPAAPQGEAPRRRGPPGGGNLRHRHRRLDPPAGLPLRGGRAETDLRPGFPLRGDRLRLLPRPGGSSGPRRRGLRHAAAGGGRIRPCRLHLRRYAGSRLPGGLRDGVQGLRIGLPREYFIEGLDPEVRGAVEAAIATYRQLGAEIVEVGLPHTEYAVACYYLIATAEASSNLARYDGVRFGLRTEEGRGLLDMYMQSRAAGFGAEVKRRIMLGTYALSSGYYDAYYLKAQKVRTLIRQDFLEAFNTVDVILTPAAPTPAFRLGEKTADPLQMYLSDIFTIPVNLAGTCGMSVPCGFSAAGLPIGLQLIGKPFDEATILRAGYAFEQATEWHRRKRHCRGGGCGAAGLMQCAPTCQSDKG
jgi:aspartyl-tRNA(Asn)/glutamyl-tRNA(Gln) amidotransferase subunit A